jgi:hypothetical protein
MHRTQSPKVIIFYSLFSYAYAVRLRITLIYIYDLLHVLRTQTHTSTFVLTLINNPFTGKWQSDKQKLQRVRTKQLTLKTFEQQQVRARKKYALGNAMELLKH